ncbi:hypothetical protein F5884DRAFT_680623 [Xylogone sp. PMI_703]|nr:hypothetical protein F5884DRAFT_680623 [Xylogone sp. PMI_703]
MPRPKRTKVAPSAPAPRIRKPAKDASTRNSKTKAREPSFDSLYDASDREGDIPKVQSVGKGKGRELSMETGMQQALNAAIEGALEAETQELPKQPVMEPIDDSSLSLGNLDASSSDVEVGRRGRETPGMDSSLISIGNFRRRPRQPSILGRAGRGRSSSIDSDIAEGTGLTSVGPKNTSSLAIGAFKRRPRQPSIMGRGPASARPSSAGLELYSSTPTISRGTYDTGTVERGRRRGSNGGTGNKRLRPDYDTEDDFNPDDESTPLNISKTNDISSLASDEDELTHMPIHISNRNQRSTSRVPGMKRTAAKAKSRARLKSQPAPEKTYEARGNPASDKENEGVDLNDSLLPSRDDEFEETENSQELEERVGKELKRATRKFAEVDKWELDFEEITASSSSPIGGR